MRKRLRKKLHRGEFQELGFTVSWQFPRSLDANALDIFFDTLVDMVEERGLTFGGGGGPEQGSGFLSKKGHGSVSEEDRVKVVEWFDALEPTVSAIAGPREDAWHSSRPEVTIVRKWIGQGVPIIILPASER